MNEWERVEWGSHQAHTRNTRQHSLSELLPTSSMFNGVPSIYRKVRICNQSLTVISPQEDISTMEYHREKSGEHYFMYSKIALQILLLANKPFSHLKPLSVTNLIKICLIALSRTEILYCTLGGMLAATHWHWLLNHRCCYFHPTHWSACNPLLEDLCAVEQSNCVAVKWAWLNWSEDLMRTPWGLSAVA